MSKILKKIILALVCISMLGLVACGEKDNNKPTEETTTPKPEYNVTLSSKDKDGNVIEGVTVSVYKEGDEEAVFTELSDEAGIIKFKVESAGKYTIRVDLAPAGYLGETLVMDVKEGENAGDLLIVSMAPDGTKENPFVVIEKEESCTIKPGTTVYYMASGSEVLFGTNNSNVVVEYNGEKYKPNADGVIEIPMTSEGPRTPINFSITNESGAETEVVFTFLSKPGSHDNPIEVTELMKKYDVNAIPKGANVYYSWIATGDGTLTVTSKEKHNTIMLYNTTSMATSSYTNGAESETVKVKKGDVVSIIVASLSGDETSDISFTLSLSE